MKKSLFTLLLMLCCMMANAEEVTVDNIIYTLNAEDNTAEVTRHTDLTDADVMIPESITVDGQAYQVTGVGHRAFSSYSHLTSIKLPNTLTSIGDFAFSKCTGLTSLAIPSSVTSIGNYAFSSCLLNALVLYCKLPDYDCLYGLKTSSIVYAYESEISKIEALWSGNVIPIDSAPYGIIDITSYIKGVSFRILKSDFYTGTATLRKVTVGDTEATADEDGLYMVTGLSPATDYTICATYDREDGATATVEKETRTKTRSITSGGYASTDGLTVTVIPSADITCPVKSYGVELDGTEYYAEDGSMTMTFSDLKPLANYQFTPFAYYDDIRLTGNVINLSTSGLLPKMTIDRSTPTAIYATGSYGESDAHVSETYFTIQEQRYATDDDERIRADGDNVCITGLDPGTTYYMSYHVKSQEGTYDMTGTATGTSSELSLAIIKTEVASGICTITAETNICDDETGVGFQWKRHDTPETADPAEVPAVISDGQMEGSVKDLQPASYDVRAFYKSVAGNYYYGDWTTFTVTAADSGIDGATAGTDKPVAIGCYGLDGRRLGTPQKGLNIIRYSDGAVHKVIVR